MTTAPPDDTAPLSEAETAALRLALAKRQWLLETLERQRALAPPLVALERRAGLSADEFLERYYAANRPVILTGEMEGWPALSWTPERLKALVGAAPIEFQAGRDADADFEINKDAHRQTAPFDAFIDRITRPGAGNEAYLTAYNSEHNAAVMGPLAGDLGRLDKFLSWGWRSRGGMPWIGPAGTFTPLHHDLNNNLIAQVVGRKRILLVPPSETGRLYNHRQVFSEVRDLEQAMGDAARFPTLEGLVRYAVDLEPGEILFMPLAWWHQVRALSFSVTFAFTNFRWPNDLGDSYPDG